MFLSPSTTNENFFLTSRRETLVYLFFQKIKRINRYDAQIADCIALTYTVYCTFTLYTNSAKAVHTKTSIQCLIIFALALFLLVEGFLP